MRRVVLSYAHFPISVARFFKMGFRKLPGVEVFSVGPCSYGVIPWQPHTDFSAYQDVPDLELFPVVAGSYPAKDVLEQLDFTPEGVVMIDAGFYLSGGTAELPRALIGTDPHCLNYHEQAKLVNAVYIMQHCYMYKTENARWLPYCYEPDVHYWDPDAPKEHDITFIGVLYPERIELLEQMRSAGLRVHYEQGRLMEEGTAFYNRGHIAWNLSSRNDLPMRFWEGLAYRNLVVTNRVSDLEKLAEMGCREGEHYIAYDRDDPQEMLEKLRYYCEAAHAEERERIATAGWVWVQQHTYACRAKQVLDSIG